MPAQLKARHPQPTTMADPDLAAWHGASQATPRELVTMEVGISLPIKYYATLTDLTFPTTNRIRT